MRAVYLLLSTEDVPGVAVGWRRRSRRWPHTLTGTAPVTCQDPGMHVAYWIVAGVLALFYAYAGGLKVIRSREQLRPMMGWVDDMPMSAVRAIGTVELLGAIGLILPPLTGIAPALAFAAAVGFVLLQIGATVVHVRRGETRQIGFNIALIALAAATVGLATTWL